MAFSRATRGQRAVAFMLYLLTELLSSSACVRA